MRIQCRNACPRLCHNGGSHVSALFRYVHVLFQIRCLQDRMPVRVSAVHGVRLRLHAVPSSALSLLTWTGACFREQMCRLASENMEQDTRTILFVDEIHRFNKTQQDYLLPFVENAVPSSALSLLTWTGACFRFRYFHQAVLLPLLL